MPTHSAPRITVVGSINVDITSHVQRLPTAGETVGGGTLSREIGGKGSNQAAAAAKLGANVRMIGAVGNDADGQWLLDHLTAAGVDTSAVETVPDPSGTALIVVDEHAENQIAVCPGANAHVRADAVHIEPDEVILTQLEVSRTVVEHLAASRPNYLAVNAAPAQQLPASLIERVDLFIANESEYALMPELDDARLVAVTYGAAGAALLAYGNEIARVAGVPADAVNTVGAGDAFCAALVIALHSEMDPLAALHTACAVGAAAVEHPASQPPLAALEEYVVGS
ncbi:ribokinase [Microbacterium mangrovi]|uniref:Ribokinase n=1 Tax=Microbacterium mangrovi TaxID=1348253 RepID=A0A0B2A463_9MICO|nr:ribokinase [Microbacterium mangrovi]KHK96589.1 ribokinase [Microbacterium mangrovi]